MSSSRAIGLNVFVRGITVKAEAVPATFVHLYVELKDSKSNRYLVLWKILKWKEKRQFQDPISRQWGFKYCMVQRTVTQIKDIYRRS